MLRDMEQTLTLVYKMHPSDDKYTQRSTSPCELLCSDIHKRKNVAMRLFIAAFMLLYMVCVNYVLACPSMTGKAVTNVGDVGEHYPLFLIEKSYHPENIAVVYTKLDTDCRVIPDREHGFLPTLDFYWLLDATRYKPMSELLKAGARRRFQFIDTHESQSHTTAFAVRTDDLSRVQHDLPSPTVQIKAARQGDACVAIAFMTLGPSNGNVTMKVESVATTTEPITLLKTMRAMADLGAIRIYALTVKGTDVVTGQPIERTYHATN